MSGFFIRTSQGEKGPFTADRIRTLYEKKKIPGHLDVYEADSGLAISVDDILSTLADDVVEDLVLSDLDPEPILAAPTRAPSRRPSTARSGPGRGSPRSAPRRAGTASERVGSRGKQRLVPGILLLILSVSFIPGPALFGVIFLIALSQAEPEEKSVVLGFSMACFLVAGFGVFLAYWGIRFIRGPKEIRTTAPRSRRLARA